MISETLAYDKQFAVVDGKRIAYIEAGEGDPIVLLHGNPTSSFLWRNIIPELEASGRVIAPDLIGQGDSEKLPASEGPERYSFEVAYHYLDGLLQSLGADQNVTLVIHDWGSGLGFHWATNHPDSIQSAAGFGSKPCAYSSQCCQRELAEACAFQSGSTHRLARGPEQHHSSAAEETHLEHGRSVGKGCPNQSTPRPSLQTATAAGRKSSSGRPACQYFEV